MPLSPPCNVNRNLKGPNSKVLIQAKVPQAPGRGVGSGIVICRGMEGQMDGWMDGRTRCGWVQDTAVSSSSERGSGALEAWPSSHNSSAWPSGCCL